MTDLSVGLAHGLASAVDVEEELQVQRRLYVVMRVIMRNRSDLGESHDRDAVPSTPSSIRQHAPRTAVWLVRAERGSSFGTARAEGGHRAAPAPAAAQGTQTSNIWRDHSE